MSGRFGSQDWNTESSPFSYQIEGNRCTFWEQKYRIGGISLWNNRWALCLLLKAAKQLYIKPSNLLKAWLWIWSSFGYGGQEQQGEFSQFWSLLKLYLLTLRGYYIISTVLPSPLHISRSGKVWMIFLCTLTGSLYIPKHTINTTQIMERYFQSKKMTLPLSIIQERFRNKSVATVQIALYHIVRRTLMCNLSQHFIKNGLAFHLLWYRCLYFSQTL